jgi:hypothetical protein
MRGSSFSTSPQSFPRTRCDTVTLTGIYGVVTPHPVTMQRSLTKRHRRPRGTLKRATGPPVLVPPPFSAPDVTWERFASASLLRFLFRQWRAGALLRRFVAARADPVLDLPPTLARRTSTYLAHSFLLSLFNLSGRSRRSRRHSGGVEYGLPGVFLRERSRGPTAYDDLPSVLRALTPGPRDTLCCLSLSPSCSPGFQTHLRPLRTLSNLSLPPVRAHKQQLVEAAFANHVPTNRVWLCC